MRGKGCCNHLVVFVDRITPAYAGKRACCWGHPAAWGDHPRTCGEKSMYDYGNNTAQGSPPRMRGKDVASVIRNCTARITPAYAGKSCTRSHALSVSWDHPRTCGEKLSQVTGATINQGSPPHMRGKERVTVLVRAVLGITPACAGKSTSTPSSTTRGRDHPRMCGEKKIMACYKPLIRGSPPHVRGKVRG